MNTSINEYSINKNIFLHTSFRRRFRHDFNDTRRYLGDKFTGTGVVKKKLFYFKKLKSDALRLTSLPPSELIHPQQYPCMTAESSWQFHFGHRLPPQYNTENDFARFNSINFYTRKINVCFKPLELVR